jgi:general secretion pathway protein I
MRRAFSLLEVMVAVALLAIGMVVLLQVQTRSVMLAQEARDMTVATMLARGKLYDCQTDLLKKGFSIGDYNEEGNFDEEGYPGWYWECHGYQPDIPTADATDIAEGMSGGGEEGGDAAAAGGDVGMGFLAPILSQMSSIMGESIRELVIIVRWGEGDDMQEMRVVTHVIDKTAVNQVAAMIQAQSSRIPGAQQPGGNQQQQDPNNPQAPRGPRQRGNNPVAPSPGGPGGGKG